MMGTHFSILIVDDNPKNIQLLASILREDGYGIAYATDGLRALKVLRERRQDMVLMDVMMPNMDGLTACRQMSQDLELKDIPVIFLTANNDTESIERGFEAGGVDYVTKPFSKRELLARIRTHLQLNDYRHHLEQRVVALTEEIEQTQREVIFAMGSIAETRSKETGNHVKRVAEYSALLGQLWGLSAQECQLLRDSSPMHDIGKIGIPDAILHKSSRLTESEWRVMQSHSRLGYEMLQASHRTVMQTAAIVALQHHERWNGKGYPNGLIGEEIHLYGRIVALADVFDALGSERCYKQAWPDEQIFTLLKEQSGQQFQPQLIDLFFAYLPQFLAIRESLRDPPFEPEIDYNG